MQTFNDKDPSSPKSGKGVRLTRRRLLAGSAVFAGSALAGSAVLKAGNTPPDGQAQRKVDVLLIGGGIMSATLGVLLRQLEPDWTVEIVERLDKVA